MPSIAELPRIIFNFRIAQSVNYYGQNFSLSQMKSNEEKMICVWMNQNLGFSFLNEMPNLRPFNQGAFARIVRMNETPELNHCPAIVLDPLPESSLVMTFLPSTASGPIDPAASFRTLELEDKNLNVAKWEGELKMVEINDHQLIPLNRLSQPVPVVLDDSTEDITIVKTKVRLIGACINFNYGLKGMRHVFELNHWRLRFTFEFLFCGLKLDTEEPKNIIEYLLSKSELTRKPNRISERSKIRNKKFL